MYCQYRQIKLANMKTTIKEANPVFTLWIGNSEKTKFFISDIKNVFKKWLSDHSKTFLEYYKSEMIVLFFLADKKGLNATWNQKDFKELYRLMKPDYLNAVK